MRLQAGRALLVLMALLASLLWPASAHAQGTADLRIIMTGPSSAFTNDLLRYQADYVSDGPDSASAVMVTFQLAPGLTFDQADSSRGCLLVSASTVQCGPYQLTAFTSGQAVVYASASSAGPGSYTTAAAVSSELADPTPADNTASITTTVQAATTDDLYIGISPLSNLVGYYYPGGTIDWNFQVANAGALDGTNVVATIDLPSGMSFVGSSPPGCTVSGQTMTCALGTIPRMSTPVAVFFETVAATTGTYGVTGTVTGDQPDANLANNSTTSTVNVIVPFTADLSVTIGASSHVLFVGQEASFVVGYSNAGPADATNVVVAITLTPGYWTFDPANSASFCSLYQGYVRCLLGTVPAGTTGTFNVSAVASQAANQTFPTQIAGDQQDPNTFNNSTSINMDVLGGIDVAARLTGTSSLPAGEKASYTMTVTDNGPVAASGVVTTISWTTSDIKDGVVLSSVTPSQGSCTASSGGPMTCSLGSIALGGDATVSFQLQPKSPGSYAVTGTVTSDVPDTDPSNNSVTIATTVPKGKSGPGPVPSPTTAPSPPPGPSPAPSPTP